MLQEHLYEIIGLIVILTFIVIYFLIKKFKQDDENLLQEVQEHKKDTLEPLLNKEESTQIKDEYEEQVEQTYKLSGEEEGSFGNLSANPFDESSLSSMQTPRQKIDVPPHGAIVKDNFKEFAGVKLLVAEDNIINQKVINGVLNKSGILITMANDGQEALEILEQNQDFNIILMDAHMPRVDGFEATRAIRANPKYEHIVIIALSGDTASDDIKKMLDSGMEDHLEKPLRMDALYDILYAYTKSDLNTTEFVEVVMTQELNGDQGLAVCGGDDIFYKDILKEFLQNYSNAPKKLHTLLEEKNTALADSMLLDFIGITANIGAQPINLIALELKKAIADTEEKSYLIILEQFEAHLKILIKDIKAYI